MYQNIDRGAFKNADIIGQIKNRFFLTNLTEFKDLCENSDENH